ncbi:hypothetical protein RCL1_006968 [Eukaryota sp. TZLM3-RCL]
MPTSQRDQRRQRKFSKSGTEHMGSWLRYGPNEPLPHEMGTSGPNGCMYDEETRRIVRFNPPSETGYRFLGPGQWVHELKTKAGVRGGDYNLELKRLEEPRDPYDEFYDDKTFSVDYDA